jgi:uncharacterized protein
MPISQYVLKVHGRCDLGCDICYVYRHADQGWRRRPAAISPQTAAVAARRIAQHAMAHGITEVRVVLHGGEPLLYGKEPMTGLLDTLTAVIGSVTRLELGIQTNGVRLDAEWCELFLRYQVAVGVSLDGDRKANDRHRLYRGGRSSYDQTLRALELLRQPRYRDLYAGILCTVDIENDPVTVYDALAAQQPSRIDLLLPHATWEHPPPGSSAAAHPYADWLLAVLRRWRQDPRRLSIRLFDSLISAVRGGPSFTEALGTDPVDMLVIETDGAWEQPDSMKTAFDGAAATGMDVSTHSVDDVAGHPAIAERQQGVAALCRTCQECQVVEICGGGLYAHRYRGDGSGFGNPSVYCDDLLHLITEVRPRRAAHRLSDDAFDTLASGPGSEKGFEELASMRLSQARALVGAVAKSIGDSRDETLRADAEAGWALLCTLDRSHPAAVRKVFGHPYTRAWAMRCLTRQGPESDRDRAHLAGLALAAASWAKVAARLRVPVVDGVACLPTVGAFQVSGETSVEVSVMSDGSARAAAGERWLPVRALSEAHGVMLEDTDPFRDCQQWDATARLDDAELRLWRERFAGAWRILTESVPDYARVIEAGLVSVVPLGSVVSSHRAATARDAFGAIAVALPESSEDLAELVLHEFQHVKMYPLLDMRHLFDPSDRQLLAVGWREDKRPVEGVLQGTYSYLALTHLKTGPHRDWVQRAAAALRASGALTSDGHRFVELMAAGAGAGP